MISSSPVFPPVNHQIGDSSESMPIPAADSAEPEVTTETTPMPTETPVELENTSETTPAPEEASVETPMSTNREREWSLLSYTGSKISAMGSTINSYTIKPALSLSKRIGRTIASIFCCCSGTNRESSNPIIQPGSSFAKSLADSSTLISENQEEAAIANEDKEDKEGWGSKVFNKVDKVLVTIDSYTITPLIKAVQAIAYTIMDLFSNTSENPDSDFDDFIETEPAQSTRLAQPSSLQSELTEDKKPTETPSSGLEEVEDLFTEEDPLTIQPNLPEPTVVKIPAKGYCLFAAVLVGLKKIYGDEIKWDIDPDFLSNDLTDNASIKLIEQPAQKLREKAISYMENELKALEKNQKALAFYEKHNNDLKEINYQFLLKQVNGENQPLFSAEDCPLDLIEQRKQLFLLKPSKSRDNMLKINEVSQLIADIKSAIEDYNTNIQMIKINYHQEVSQEKIKELTQLYEMANLLTEELKAFKFQDSKQITEGKRRKEELQRQLTQISRQIQEHNNAFSKNIGDINSWSTRLLPCAPTGFNSSEIPALKSYLNNMKRPTEYANLPEIMALSHLFQVPIKVYTNYEGTYDYSQIHNPEFDEQVHPQLFNGHLEKEPICLDFNGHHYNLILS